MPITTDIFKKYPNKFFFETGTLFGDGVKNALDAGFEKVMSVELSPKYFQLSNDRFIENPNVSIYFGESYKILSVILPFINEPITFWLDGHCSEGDTAKGDFYSPLIQEIEAIEKHHIKNHTIIIDDVRLFQEKNELYTFDITDVKKKLISVNPSYTFSYEDGFQTNDILIAKL